MKERPTIKQELPPMDPQEVAYWKAEIKASIKRKTEEFEKRVGYKELIRYFESLQVVEGAKMDQVAIADEFGPAAVSILGSTYNQNPSVSVTAGHPDADGMVKPSLIYLIQHPEFKPFKLTDLMQASIKYSMDHSGMKEEMQLAVFDLLFAGFAVVEENHLCESTQEPTPQDFTTPNPAETPNPILDSIGQGIQSVVDKVKSALTKDEAEEKIAEETSDHRTDMTSATFTKRWNPLDVLFDARAIVFKDSRFIGKIVRMSIADFNTRYPAMKGKINATSEAVKEIPYFGHNNPEYKKSVVLYSLEIKKKSGRNCIAVFADGLNECVDYYEDPIVTNNFKLKYKSLDNYGVIYPMSRAKKAKKPQDDINHYLTVQYEHVDRAMRKIAVYMEGLTQAGQSAQRSPDPYAIVEKQSPQPVYEAMPAPSVVPENKEIVLLMKESINKAFQTNELAKSGQSDNQFATQDALQHQSFQASTNIIVDALGDLADQIIDTKKDIIMQIWDGQDYFKVTGINGAESWYDPSMGPLSDLLVGDYQVKTDIVSAARPNPMQDQKDAVELAQFITSPLIVQFAQMHGKRPSMAILDNVVKRFNQNPEMVFEDEQPPVMPGMMPGQSPGQPMPAQPIPGNPNVIPVPQQTQVPPQRVAQRADIST